MIHFHAPVLLSEYVQEVGRAGRDGERAEALTLVSEPTGWLDPEDRQRQQFFQNQLQQQQQKACQLVGQLPREGDIQTVTQQFRDGLIALAILQKAGQLEWRDPFHYVIRTGHHTRSPVTDHSAQQMQDYLHHRTCRWQFLLRAFGFPDAAADLGRGCGHCDRCC